MERCFRQQTRTTKKKKKKKMPLLRNSVTLAVFSIASICFLFAAALPNYYTTLKVASNNNASAKTKTTVSVSFFEKCAVEIIGNSKRIISYQCQFLTLDRADCESRKIVDTIGKVLAICSIVFSFIVIMIVILNDRFYRTHMALTLHLKKNKTKEKEKTEDKKEAATDPAPVVVATSIDVQKGLLITIFCAGFVSTAQWVVGLISFLVPICNNVAVKDESDSVFGFGIFVTIAGSVVIWIGFILTALENWGKEKIV